MKTIILMRNDNGTEWIKLSREYANELIMDTYYRQSSDIKIRARELFCKVPLADRSNSIGSMKEWIACKDKAAKEMVDVLDAEEIILWIMTAGYSITEYQYSFELAGR